MSVIPGGKEILEYATVELFCERGLRVNGKVSQDVLSVLSQGVTAKQKKTDERGWSVSIIKFPHFSQPWSYLSHSQCNHQL